MGKYLWTNLTSRKRVCVLFIMDSGINIIKMLRSAPNPRAIPTHTPLDWYWSKASANRKISMDINAIDQNK
jgi:hypothetical protein